MKKGLEPAFPIKNYKWICDDDYEDATGITIADAMLAEREK